MKRLLSVLLVLVLAFTLIATASASDFAPQTVKLALVVAAGTPVEIASQQFADEVYKRTDGKIKIELYAGGILGNETELKESISLGAIEMVNLGWSLLSNKFSYSMSMIGYYEIESRDTMNAFFDGETAHRLYDAYESLTGVRVIASNWQQGMRHTIATRAFTSLNELKGLKIRTPAGVTLDLDAWTAWGALPTGMALSEVYSAIEQKVIDSVECPLDYLWANSFHEAGATNLMLTGHQLYNNLIAVNAKWFDALPEDIQKIIIDTAIEYGDYQSQLVVEKEEEYLNNFRNAGVNIVEVPEEMKEELKALVAPINKEQKEKCLDELEGLGF